MSRHVALALAALAAGLAGAAVVVAVAATRGAQPRLAPPAGDAVQVATALEPGRILFGDRVTAVVEVTVDRRRVDPSRIEVAAFFRPFYRNGAVRTERTELGDTLVVRYRYPIQCVVRACAVSGEERAFTLPVGLVRYTPREGDVVSLPLTWPALQVASRLSPGELAAMAGSPSLLAADADLESLPPLGGRDGTLLGWLFAGFAALLALVLGAAAGLRLRPARLPRVREPEVALAPLPAAIAAARRSLDRDEDERRAALDLLARRLDEAGEPEHAREARRLAWSQTGPERPRVEALLGALPPADADTAEETA